MSKENEIISLLKNEIAYFKKLKLAIGEIHGHIHSLAVRAAQIYLSQQHPQVQEWQVEEKYGSGLDIIGKSGDKKIVVAAEVKTTARAEKETLGRIQKGKIKNDIEKLMSAGAAYRYLFIIDNKNKHAIENILKNEKNNDIILINIFEC